ncbi:MAG: hypothetical protein QOI10_1334 [Solirubrobacterales bacterium]|nr:hypothetical protein [Solirubrobacterales bacterium]
MVARRRARLAAASAAVTAASAAVTAAIRVSRLAAVRRLTDLPRYAAASAFSFVFVIAVTAGLHELAGVSQTLAPAIALVAAFAVNFTLLRVWVFPGQGAPVGRQLLQTAITSLVFRVLEYGIFLGLHLGLEINYLVATGASVCISALGKYFVYREIVFSRGRSGPPSSGSDPVASGSR